MIRGRVHKYGDNVDTDVIIPARYCTAYTEAELGPHALEDLDPNFVKKVKKGDVLVAGWNFGCGSSREQAVWALTAFGIRCIIGPAPAEFFRKNCLNNGVLPIALDAARMVTLTQLAKEVDGHKPFTVDLEAHEIRGPDGYVCEFAIAPFERTALLEGLDEIGLTLKHVAAIQAWETRTAGAMPFLQASIADVGVISPQPERDTP
jgi:3-isopropylmalate/(R)-2-methylmalate dehydratase small subunit